MPRSKPTFKKRKNPWKKGIPVKSVVSNDTSASPSRPSSTSELLPPVKDESTSKKNLEMYLNHMIVHLVLIFVMKFWTWTNS